MFPGFLNLNDKNFMNNNLNTRYMIDMNMIMNDKNKMNNNMNSINASNMIMNNMNNYMNDMNINNFNNSMNMNMSNTNNCMNTINNYNTNSMNDWNCMNTNNINNMNDCINPMNMNNCNNMNDCKNTMNANNTYMNDYMNTMNTSMNSINALNYINNMNMNYLNNMNNNNMNLNNTNNNINSNNINKVNSSMPNLNIINVEVNKSFSLDMLNQKTMNILNKSLLLKKQQNNSKNTNFQINKKQNDQSIIQNRGVLPRTNEKNNNKIKENFSFSKCSGNIINIIFETGGIRHIFAVFENLSMKELILKFIRKVGISESLKDIKLLFILNGSSIPANEEKSIKTYFEDHNIGSVNNSKIVVIDGNNVIGA